MLYKAVLSYLQQKNISYKEGVLKHVISIDTKSYRLTITFITPECEHYILLIKDNNIQQIYESNTNLDNYQSIINSFMENFND